MKLFRQFIFYKCIFNDEHIYNVHQLLVCCLKTGSRHVRLSWILGTRGENNLHWYNTITIFIRMLCVGETLTYKNKTHVCISMEDGEWWHWWRKLLSMANKCTNLINEHIKHIWTFVCRWTPSWHYLVIEEHMLPL